MSSQDKRQQTAKAYLAKLQGSLPSAAYQQLMKCLQQYRKDHNTLQVSTLLRIHCHVHVYIGTPSCAHAANCNSLSAGVPLLQFNTWLGQMLRNMAD